MMDSNRNDKAKFKDCYRCGRYAGSPLCDCLEPDNPTVVAVVVNPDDASETLYVDTKESQAKKEKLPYYNNRLEIGRVLPKGVVAPEKEPSLDEIKNEIWAKVNNIQKER